MSAQILFGEIVEESADKGPFKLNRIQADGKKLDASMVESTGFASGAMTGAPVLVFLPDGDMGKAVAIPMAPTGERVDSLKPGEAQLTNFKTKAMFKLDDDGHLQVQVPGDINLHADGNVNLGGAGGKRVARIGDMVQVTSGSSAGLHPIVEGSSKVFAVD